MQTVEIDFDVFKEITNRRKTEGVTPNDVLRELFGLDPIEAKDVPLMPSGKPWVTKGVTFPYGAQFRATYKGQEFIAEAKDGALFLNGKRFISPSAAAVSITGNSVNGWIFWECKLPGSDSWKIIKDYRMGA
ncbi:MAG: hypothetical protein K940chlam3_01498 [Chlamydiae bacterium]|nr:hypothetical protein [Chlamydiota bacterium]